MKKLFRTLLATILPLVVHSVFSAEELPPYYVKIRKKKTLIITSRTLFKPKTNLSKQFFKTADELKEIIQNTKRGNNSIEKIEIDSYKIKKDELKSLFTVLLEKDQTVCLKLCGIKITPDIWKTICNNANKINELELIYLDETSQIESWNTFITNTPNDLTLMIHDYNPKNYSINNLLQALAQHNNKNTYLNLYFEQDTEADWIDFTNKCNTIEDGSIKSVKKIRFSTNQCTFEDIKTLLNKFDFNNLDNLFLYTSNQKGFLEKLKKDQDLIEKFKKLEALVIGDHNDTKNQSFASYTNKKVKKALEKLNNSAPEPEEQEESKEEEENSTTVSYTPDSEEKKLLEKTKNKNLEQQQQQQLELEPEQPESWFTIKNAAYATAALGSCYLVYRWFTKKKQQPQPIKRTKDGTLPTFAQIQNTLDRNKLAA